MSRLDPAVAAVRLAVRASTLDSDFVLAATSGGADSLALAAAVAFAAPRDGKRAGLLTVDHQLQAGSAERAAAVALWGSSVGLEPAEVLTVDVNGPGGPEAAAREARYAALAEAARRLGARAVLLGHTQDDQAETVLLALARGAGPRGLSGMPAARVIDGVEFRRPLLGISRETCRAACAAQGLVPWEDPHNADPSYARARVRHDAMPALLKALGPDVVPNLARTASLIAADSAHLDALAAVALGQSIVDGGLSVAALSALPDPVRTRVLHSWAASLGAPGAALSHRHVAALDALVTAWHGQGPTMLPGGISVTRISGVLRSS
ncbi:MAG TPA: tRNA lysidine(34) synthetase TilS [Candidatus Limnocylindrales bacterium]